MLDMCKSANRHSRGLSEHVIKWPVPWNYGKVVENPGDTIGTRGEAFDSLLQGSIVDGVSLGI